MDRAFVRDALVRAAYGVVEVATVGRGVRRVVCGESLRFPARWSRYYPAIYEPDTFAFLRQHVRPGSTVLDIGAHIGLFTVLLARLVGPRGLVVSFEPSPATRAVLSRTVALNDCESRVMVRAEAVAGESGARRFHELDVPGCNSNSLVAPAIGAGARTIPAVAIDDFVRSSDLAVGCLKIDVEGAELEVIRGAFETIGRYRPVIALGIHPDAIHRAGGSLSDIWRELERQRMTVCHGGAVVSRPWFERQRELFDVQLLPQQA